MPHFHHATAVIGISDVNTGAVRLADDATDELSDLVLESGYFVNRNAPSLKVDNESALVQNT